MNTRRKRLSVANKNPTSDLRPSLPNQRIQCLVAVNTQSISNQKANQSECFTLVDDSHFKMNKGYHVANFTLPLYDQSQQSIVNSNAGFFDNTLITHGYKSTGKSTILKQ